MKALGRLILSLVGAALFLAPLLWMLAASFRDEAHLFEPSLRRWLSTDGWTWHNYADAWRRAEYGPGDLVVFSLETPHSGLANRSNRYFRLSMDIRGMRKSDNIPTIGTVVAIDENAVTVAEDNGTRHTFRLNDDTFCRVARGRLSGMPLELAEIPRLVKVGDPVYVASNRGTATFMRPQH